MRLSASTRARLGGAAAVAGGAAWLAKALAILATGEQPPLVFAIGPLLFALGLLGLHARLDARARLARAGAALTAVSLVAFALSALMAAAQPAWVPRDETLTPVGAAGLVGVVALLAALALLGRRAQVERALGGGWRHLPLALAVGMPLGVVLGGLLLAPLDERLLEVPLVGIGVAWMALGWRIAR